MTCRRGALIAPLPSVRTSGPAWRAAHTDSAQILSSGSATNTPCRVDNLPKHNFKPVHAGCRINDLAYLRDGETVRGKNRYGVFLCACGSVVERNLSHFRNGRLKDCGHSARALSSARATRHGHCASGASTKTHEAWHQMKARCLNPAHASYGDYGARGISVCERWMSFDNFLSDMGNAPDGMSLDRYPDNNGNYEPSNCRWATMREQCNNKRNNHILEFNGRRLTISEWSDATGIKDCTISERLRHGWSVSMALMTKTRPRIPRSLGT